MCVITSFSSLYCAGNKIGEETIKLHPIRGSTAELASTVIIMIAIRAGIQRRKRRKIRGRNKKE